MTLRMPRCSQTLTATPKLGLDEMRKNGYTNLMFYTSASWLDENNLRKKGPVNTAQFGLPEFLGCPISFSKLSVNDAKSLRYNGKAGAWQFTSQTELLPGKHLFDHSVDYTGRFTANSKPTADPTEGSLSGKIDIVNNDTMTGRFDVVISNVKAPNGVRTVSVPIWSETGGQDDLVWYTANRQTNYRYFVRLLGRWVFMVAIYRDFGFYRVSLRFRAPQSVRLHCHYIPNKALATRTHTI